MYGDRLLKCDPNECHLPSVRLACCSTCQSHFNLKHSSEKSTVDDKPGTSVHQRNSGDNLITTYAPHEYRVSSTTTAHAPREDVLPNTNQTQDGFLNKQTFNQGTHQLLIK